MSEIYKDDHECICDFAGNYNQCGFWYDYYPYYKTVKFGGILSDIPNLEIDYEPTEEECETWILKHKEFDYRSLSKLEVMVIMEDYPEDKITEALKNKLQEKTNETEEKIKG